jgi:uncharacterized membrane protein YidH (DUF202 family)
MKALGIVLIVLGLLGLVVGGFSWTDTKTVVDAGPIQLTAKERKSLPIPPIAGGILLIAGVAIMLKGGK